MQALVKKKPINPPAWYEGLELAEKPEPEVSVARPVKIKIISAGICGTDVGIYAGKDSLANAMAKIKGNDVILGHEFCGRVVAIHDSAKLAVAQLLLRKKLSQAAAVNYVAGKIAQALARDSGLVDFLNKNFYVSAEMHFTCGQCLQCRTGHQYVCNKTIGKGLHEDGAFTDYMVVPVNRLVLFEFGEAPPEIISFMDALGNAVHTAQSADIVGKNILITGAGVQGLMSCAVARQLGANKIFITNYNRQSSGQQVDKLAIAQKLGADFVFDVAAVTGQKALKETVAEQTDQTGVDVVFEMSGHYDAFKQAFENIRLGGTLLLLGLPAGKLEVDFSKEVVFKGLTIKGIYGRRVFDTWDLMRYLLAKGLAKTILESGIITHQLALRDFEQGFGALLNGQAIKVLLKP